MAKVKGPRPGIIREYVPAACENREDPEPARVFLRSPTEREKRQINASVKYADFAVNEDGGLNKDDDGNPFVRVNLERALERQEYVIENFVDHVEDYYGPHDEPIKTGKDLIEHGSTSLVIEVAQEIENGTSLLIAEANKIKKPGVSSSETTKALDGTAKIAENTGLTSSETVTE